MWYFPEVLSKSLIERESSISLEAFFRSKKFLVDHK